MQSVLSDLLLPSFPVDLFVNAIFIIKYVCVLIAMIMNAPFSFKLFISMQKGKPIIIPNNNKNHQTFANFQNCLNQQKIKTEFYLLSNGFTCFDDSIDFESVFWIIKTSYLEGERHISTFGINS